MDDQQQSSKGDIFPIKQSESNLDPIQSSLSEKIKLEKTSEEVQSYLNLIKQREEQIQQREYRNFQLSEGTNQLKYDRKIAVYKESVAVVFSIISIVLGMLTIGSIPLIAPLLIILALIRPLGYSMGEVVEFFRGITESRNLPEEEIREEKPKKPESSE